ncbi:MAG: hypothetical protein WBQ54_05775 [Pseudolabrys sp.]
MGIQVRSSADIELALRKLPGFGLVVVPDAFANVNRARIIKSAAENRIPATYSYQQFVLDGGLMTYGPDPADIVRRSAAYVDRILKGSIRGRGTGVVFVTFEPVTRERSLHTRCFLQSLQLKAGFIEAFAKTG